ncbi:MAG TPA: hypothetical protein VFC09_15820 [Candidatus Dormibacteraeota bacterium]|nr:hypothetical protein [Candidatus Dormibacteraeota bacterium]
MPIASPELAPGGELEQTPSTDGAAPAEAAAEAPEAEAAQAPSGDPGTADAADGAKPARKRAGKAPTGSAQGRRTTAQRLGNFPRADRPAEIPAPEHHHLPGWVRRDFARARPPLSNILALLEGDARQAFSQRISELTAGISAGRFSLAWQYPDLVDEGRALYEKQRRESAETARASRQLDTARRRIQDRIRDAADQLTPEVAARLQRQLRSAGDGEAINAVASELDGVATAAKTTAEKRREREIERTRARIRRSAAVTGTAEAAPQTETWQDVLRRFAEEQAAGSRSSE